MHASGLRSVSSYSSLRLAEPFHQGRRNEDGLHVDLNVQDVPAIPTLLGSDEMTTPLPTLPMTVLSIMMLGEFLSSNVSTPFLLFMVKGFGVFQEDSEAAFWTGILVATFFLTQFLTSLAWAIIADRYGRRIVLVSSLFGSAVTCGLFGTSTSLSQAIVIRLLQGAFAGSVGVARGSVPLVTNASNEGRAYAILGFCWGFGGMLGPIIGGLFERPAEKWPLVFGNIKLFVNLPYLLPCAVAAAILLFGALLACFLGPNGESPAANVHSKTEKLMSQLDFDELPSTMTPLLTRVRSLTPLPSLHRAIPRKISRRLRNPSREPRFGSLGSSFFPSSSLPNRANTGIDLYRTFTASSQTSGLGSTRTSRVIDNYGSDIDTSELNLGERFVLANENAVNNISDLWVAAAISTDTEGEIDEDETPNLDSIVHSYFDEDETRGRGNTRTTRTRKHLHTGPSLSIPRASKSTSRTRHQASYSSLRQSQSQTGIFANTGVDSIVDLTDAPESAPLANLTPIFEARPLVLPPPPSDILEPLRIENCTEAITVLEAKLLWGGIPIAIIVQYGLLALHTTTHDQVFLSYLITEYEGGGLNLGAADFAQIIGIMGIAQLFYQFYAYPYLGPPRGHLSHLTMFRLGTVLFIVSYLTVIAYRVPFAGPDGGKMPLMFALIFSTAIRYGGAAFTFTSISILLNYMSAPESVQFANGLAQSVVSLGRFIGPMLGGWIWSTSVKSDPAGYPVGFICCSAVCVVALLHSLVVS